MARSAFLPAIALLALAPVASAQVVIGGPAPTTPPDVSVDLSALDALRPNKPTPLARATFTAPSAALPSLPAQLAPAALAVRPAAVLRPTLPSAPERTALAPVAPVERASLPSLDLARVAPPRLAAPSLDRPVAASLTVPSRVEHAPIETGSALRVPVGLAAPTAPALRDAPTVRANEPPTLTTRLHLQRAALRAPDATLPAAPPVIAGATVAPFQPRYVLVSPRLERPVAPSLDALPKLDRTDATPALLRDAVLTAPDPRPVDAPRTLADRDAPNLQTRALQARLTPPSPGTLAALPNLQPEAAPRFNAALVAPPAETRLRSASLAMIEPASLATLPLIAPRNAPDLDTPVVRASLRAPAVSTPSAPSQLPNLAAPQLNARPVLLSPRLEAPARQLPDAPLQLERQSHAPDPVAPAALFAASGIVAPEPRAVNTPRDVATREAPSLTVSPYLLRVSLRAPVAELPQLRTHVQADAAPRLTTRLVAPHLAAPQADAIERAAPIEAATVSFALPVRSAASIVPPEPRPLIAQAVLTNAEPPALRASERALPANLRAPQTAPIDAVQVVSAVSAPQLDNLTRVVAPQFELAVLRPSAPPPLPPSVAPQLETQRVQNAVLREPPPSAAASVTPVINERLAFVASEPPPPAALGPTPKIPAPRTTPQSSTPTTKVPPKPGQMDGTAPPAHAAQPADPNPVAPQATPAPNIAAPDGSNKSSVSPSAPEKGERSAVRLQFSTDATVLPSDVERSLAPVLNTLKATPKARIILRGYAAASDDSAGRAKRIALTRALELRNFFIAHGIDGARIDVRALGAPDDNSTADRVDIGLLE
ncbi:OmpA family protein [Roseiterribacter gracilis]|uniref:OmpA-like domain-containing protein n=1 Tax=Roseiterribacter gracilis TaxID=2812848 RepID=A0A8S8XGE4_9PROT|nr:hypothetical protein TMPK1_24270 [Rhodospirillales bacterium TMPK1]